MSVRRYGATLLAIPLAIATLMAWNDDPDIVYAQTKGMEAPPSKVEITIKDRQHGYETVGMTMPSQHTIIVVRNQDSVTHGLASTLFKNIPVKVEGGDRGARKTVQVVSCRCGKDDDASFRYGTLKFRPGNRWG